MSSAHHQNEAITVNQAQRPTVLISGASFAGLAAAWWMHRLGYAVTVVEIASAIKKGGTPVDIREGVVDVVKRMGLLEKIAALSLKDRPMQFLNGSGEPVARMPPRGEDDNEGYEIERDDLLDILLAEVKDNVEFLFEDSIAALEQSPDDVAVTFTHAGSRRYNLVLGCDGTHSAVRRMCFGEEALFSVFLSNYFGLTIVDRLLIDADAAQMFNVPGKAIMLNTYNGKTDIAFCFYSEDEIAYDRRNREEQRQMIRDRFAGEGWRVPELLAEMDRCDNFYFDQLCQIRMKSWTSGRVALVGDAGYCPSPAAGMGGSMAILGAAALADAMQKYPGDYSLAFQEYDRSFRAEAEEIQQNAVEFGLEMFMPRTEEALAQRNLQFNTGR